MKTASRSCESVPYLSQSWINFMPYTHPTCRFSKPKKISWPCIFFPLYLPGRHAVYVYSFHLAWNWSQSQRIPSYVFQLFFLGSGLWPAFNSSQNSLKNRVIPPFTFGSAVGLWYELGSRKNVVIIVTYDQFVFLHNIPGACRVVSDERFYEHVGRFVRKSDFVKAKRTVRVIGTT